MPEMPIEAPQSPDPSVNGAPPPAGPDAVTPSGLSPQTATASDPASGAAPPEEKPKAPNPIDIKRALDRRERDLVVRQQQFAEQQRQAQAQMQAQIDQRVKEALDKEFAAFDADPVAFAEKRGFDRPKLAHRLVNGGNAKTPEELAKEAAAEAVRKFQEEQSQKEQQSQRAKLEADFIAVGKSAEDKYQHAFDEWSEGEMLREAYATISTIRARAEARGEPPPRYTDAELWDYLDQKAQKRQARRQERQAARTRSGDGKQDPQGSTKRDGDAPQAGKGKPAVTTLGNGLSRERQTVSQKDWLDMSPDEQDAAIKAATRSA